jgi:hypothetical protein
MTVPPGAGVPLHHHAVEEAFTLLEGSAEFAGWATTAKSGSRFVSAMWSTWRTGRITVFAIPVLSPHEFS